jgi:hypothetical protein
MAFACMDVKTFTLPVFVFGIMPAPFASESDASAGDGDTGSVFVAPRPLFAR